MLVIIEVIKLYATVEYLETGRKAALFNSIQHDWHRSRQKSFIVSSPDRKYVKRMSEKWSNKIVEDTWNIGESAN